MFAANVPEFLRQGHNRQVLAYLDGQKADAELVERVQRLVSATGLGAMERAGWAVWHINGMIFAYASGEHEVGYLVETTDSDHPAGKHWEVQSLYDPSENLDRNLKNALCLVCWD